jgi:ArsR family transcriptional regulator, zinc-responsive transcriptional repressor
MKGAERFIDDRVVSAEFLARAAEMLKMLAHPHRLRIIELLKREGAVDVTGIVNEITIPQSSVSQHLNQMKRMNLLTAERTGRKVIYRIKDPHVFNLLECICSSYHEEDVNQKGMKDESCCNRRRGRRT